MQSIKNDIRPRSISLDNIPKKSVHAIQSRHKPSLSGGERKLSYKQQWYKKNSRCVKGYNKEYYQKYKEKLRQKATEKYNLIKHNSKN